MPSRIRVVMVPSSSTPRTIPTDRRSQGDRHATRTHLRGQGAGGPDCSRLGHGDFNQLLAVPRGHRPHGGGRQSVEVAVLMTPSAVGRVTPGWWQWEGGRFAAVLVAAHLPGALVAVGPPHLRLPWLEWRPRGASTRSGSGVAPPWSSRGRHPGPSRRTWGQPSAARRRTQWLVEQCSAPVMPAAGGWPGPDPV